MLRIRPLGLTRVSNTNANRVQLPASRTGCEEVGFHAAQPPHTAPAHLEDHAPVLRGLAPIGPLLERHRRRPHRRTQRRRPPPCSNGRRGTESGGRMVSCGAAPYFPRGVPTPYARRSRNRALTHGLPPRPPSIPRLRYQARTSRLRGRRPLPWPPAARATWRRLLHRVAHVRAHGVVGDVELVRDLGTAAAERHQTDDLAFSIRQRAPASIGRDRGESARPSAPWSAPPGAPAGDP